MADYEAIHMWSFKAEDASISSYSPSSGYTYRTEEDILDEMKRDKIISYHRTRARFEEIDRVVKLFAERKEFHVIRMYYFGEDAQGNERPAGAEPYTWETIAAELEGMGLIRDAKSARRWRNKIVNDMAVCMFGKPAAVGVVHTGRSGTRQRIKTGQKMPVSRPFRALVCTVHICYNYYAD